MSCFRSTFAMWTDPEHPYTLEQLNVVTENHIAVSDAESYVRCEALPGPPDVMQAQERLPSGQGSTASSPRGTCSDQPFLCC